MVPKPTTRLTIRLTIRLTTSTRFSHMLQMEAVAARGELEAIVSAYARPTRIVRGKEMSDTWQVGIGRNRREMSSPTSRVGADAEVMKLFEGLCEWSVRNGCLLW